VGGKGGDGLIRREANLLHRSLAITTSTANTSKALGELSRDRIGTANTHKALGALRHRKTRSTRLSSSRSLRSRESRGPPALLAALRCLKVRGSRSAHRPFSPPGQHSTAALPFPWSRGRDIVAPLALTAGAVRATAVASRPLHSRPCQAVRKRDPPRTRRVRGRMVSWRAKPRQSSALTVVQPRARFITRAGL